MGRIQRGTGEAWLRGGQTLGHTFDMIMEVVGRLAIPAIIWGSICVWLANTKSSELEQTYGLQGLQAWFFGKVGYPFPKQLAIRAPDGVERVYLNRQVPGLDWFQPYAHSYYHHLWLAFGMWLCGCVLIGVLATRMFIDSGEEKLRARFIRGQVTVPLRQLIAQIYAFNSAEAKRRNVDHYVPAKLVGVPYPYATEHEHSLTVGSPGSGKSQAIHQLLESIRERGDRAVIYDPELEYTTYHFDPASDVILNPYDGRSVAWTPFNDARELPEYEKLAACIFKEPKHGDPYWTKATRQVFVYAAYQLRRLHPNATLDDLLMLFFGPLEILQKVLENTPAARHLAGGSGPRTDSLMSVLAEGVNSLVHLAGNTGDFSLRRWVNDPEAKPGFLFLSAPETHMESLRPLLSFWSEIVVSSLLGRPVEHPRHTTWLVLDEFPSLGKVTSLASGPERLRKYGGAVVLGMQQVSQIQEIYGQETAQTIVGQCATKLILRCQDPETAKYMAEQLGRRQTRRVDETVSYGANSLRDGVGLTPREELELVALPDQVMNLPKFHGFIRVSNARDGLAFPISTIKFRYVAREKRALGLQVREGPSPIDAFFAKVASPRPGGSPSGSAPTSTVGSSGPTAPGNLVDRPGQSPSEFSPANDQGAVREAEDDTDLFGVATSTPAAATAPSTPEEPRVNGGDEAADPLDDAGSVEGEAPVEPPATSAGGRTRGGPNEVAASAEASAAVLGGGPTPVWESARDALEETSHRLREEANEQPTAYQQLADKFRREELGNIPLTGLAVWNKPKNKDGKGEEDGQDLDAGDGLELGLTGPDGPG